MLEIVFGELVGVDDQRPAFFQIGQINFQCRRVHGHQHIGLVAGRANVVAGKIQLEAADSGQAAGGRPNLGWKIRQSRDVVADDRRSVGELRPGQLHAVAGIAGKTDGDGFEFFKMLLDGFNWWFDDCAHVVR